MRIENIKRLYKLETKHIENISQNVSYDFNTSLILKDNEKFTLSKKESKVFEYFLKKAHFSDSQFFYHN